MQYSNHSKLLQNPKADSRIVQLQKDNHDLSLALEELNECYQTKISILEEQIERRKRREQELLEWKSQYIDKQLFNSQRYENQLQRMIQMMESMAQNFQDHQQKFKEKLQQQQEDILHLQNQNQGLKQDRKAQDDKMEHLAKKYIVEIERLNNQLKDLKEEVSFSIPEINQSADDEFEQSENVDQGELNELPVEAVKANPSQQETNPLQEISANAGNLNIAVITHTMGNKPQAQGTKVEGPSQMSLKK